jgi:hypothetical protein
MTYNTIKTLTIGAILSLAVLNASAESANQDPQKAEKSQSQVKPHSHPADKGTAPAPDARSKDKQDAGKEVDKETSDKHSHPRDGK